MRIIGVVLLLLALGLLGLLGVATWRGLPENETKTQRGGELMFGERGVAIEGTTIAKYLGQADQSVEAAGRFVCVDLRVTNHAKVADFIEFPDHAAVLVDEDGSTFRVDAAATRIARQLDPTDHGSELPPGGSRVTHLAFDVPPDAMNLRLRFEFGGPLGNVINGAVRGYRTLALE